ncbi:MAG TPA: aminodeoxychorismate synthase component I [Rubricoccaceae bacterium]|nr:aminodeoxychorismate synthase component I [Rubricoccaceae bacterium]
MLTARTAAGVPALLDALDRVRDEGRYAAGFLAYEAGYALEPSVFDPPADGLLGWFGVYDAPERLAGDDADVLLAEAGAFRLGTPRFALEQGDYEARVADVRALIREGDVYQINLTAPFRFAFEGDPRGLYRAARRQQRVPYGAFIDTGEGHVLSFSPELFFRLDGRRITARPMKGTAPRGATPEEDDRLAAALAADEKNRAENLMIVDLLRNDLARVSEPGSVGVPRLFETERYETVTQMTSTVTATLRPEATLADVLRALFPCGSVTGAPKLRAIRRIRELEIGPRGVYCGAVGYLGPRGAVFNVPIRTVELRGGEGRLGVGSGIVWDSEAGAEYDECLLKARFLLEAT